MRPSVDNNTVIQIISLTLFVLLLVAGIFISTFIAARQRLQQEMKIAQVELSYEKELRQVETEVSEQMMQRFAQELHDHIGHSLTVIRLLVENKRLDVPELDSVFQPIELALNDASQQLRLLSRSLNTDYINNIGLKQAIQIEIDKLSQLRRQQLHWTEDYTGALLDKNQELVLFRIFQEIIQNMLRHSGAENVHIALSDAQHNILHIRDDGTGFIPEQILVSPRASGLKNIMKRASISGMTCSIHSAPGKGCHITVGLAEPAAIFTTT
ncbi:sensor histidine kinase [Chitinophagaceae bacterium MMS25-I14]